MVTVLTLAPMQAWAECAWVLWWERNWSSYSYKTADAHIPGAKGTSKDNHSWNILAAYPTHGACERQQELKIADVLKSWRKETAEATHGEHAINHEPGSNILTKRSRYVGEETSTFWNTLRYICLPDTIDPRELKEGGR